MPSSPTQLVDRGAVVPGRTPDSSVTVRRSPPRSQAGVTRRPLLTRRSLRYALGLLWLLDGVLQLQPFMFTRGFARLVIAPTAAGQPFFVAAPVRWNAHLIGAHPALFNGAFAGVQLALGIGLLLPRTCRLALVASIAWAGGVWYLGEGLGGVAGGHVSGLVGAPGAALLYAVLALAAWPGRHRQPLEASPEAATRPPRWILKAWAALWLGYAVLSLLPGNGSSSAIEGQLSSSASTVSPWLADLDHWVADAVHGAGAGSGVLLVAAQLSIGLLALGSGRLQRAALWSGMALALAYWAGGQSFGQLFSGQATDPSTGPLLVLMGLAGLGAVAGADYRIPRLHLHRTPRDATRRRAAMS